MPVASSHRCLAPVAAMRAATARVTTSRGARSPSGWSPAMTGDPSPSRSTAPSPRMASEMRGRGVGTAGGPR